MASLPGNQPDSIALSIKAHGVFSTDIETIAIVSSDGAILADLTPFMKAFTLHSEVHSLNEIQLTLMGMPIQIHHQHGTSSFPPVTHQQQPSSLTIQATLPHPPNPKEKA